MKLRPFTKEDHMTFAGADAGANDDNMPPMINDEDPDLVVIVGKEGLQIFWEPNLNAPMIQQAIYCDYQTALKLALVLDGAEMRALNLCGPSTFE